MQSPENFPEQSPNRIRLNRGGLIFESIGEDMLTEITADYLDLLDTFVAICEKNGDYALGIFSSGWCRFMHEASCESCWQNASLASMQTDQSVDIECIGGLRQYAVPIKAGNEVVGSVSFGYGDPPTDPVKLRELAERYGVDAEHLKKLAGFYKSRPSSIIELSKKRLHICAKLIGEIVYRKQMEQALREERDFSAAVMDTIGTLVLVLDCESRIVKLNHVCEQLTGYSSDEVKGKHITNLLLPEETQGMEAVIQELVSGQFPNRHENYLVARDGTRHLISWSHSTIKDETGRIKYIVATGTDITEQRQSAEANARLAAIVESSDDAIIGKTLDGIITSWNKGAERMYQYSAEEVIGHHISLIIPPDRLDELSRILKKIKAGRRVEPHETQRIRKDGRVMFVLLTVSPVKSSSGRLIGASTISRDITDRKRSEQELADARAEAERRNAQLESIFASLAEGVSLLDSNGRIVSLNDAAKEILGLRPDEPFPDRGIYGRYTLDGGTLSEEESAAYRALHGETVKDQRYRLVMSDGRELIVGISASPVRDGRGRIIGAVNVFRDISKQVEFERRQQELLEHESRIAEILQQALVPPKVDSELQGCRIAVNYQAALDEANVGGDFYDVFEIGESKLGVLIGDVAGKGLPAAIRVAAARYSVRNLAHMNLSPSRILSLANKTLSRDSSASSPMLTLFFAVVDSQAQIMTYANGGHEPPVILRKNGELEVLDPTGCVLGVMEDLPYSEESIGLSPGDRLVAVTDGITEARTRDNHLFGQEGMMMSLRRNYRKSPEDMVHALLRSATKFAGGTLQDDAAIVAVELTGEK